MRLARVSAFDIFIKDNMETNCCTQAGGRAATCQEMSTPWGVGSGGRASCCACLRQIQRGVKECAINDHIFSMLEASAATAGLPPPCGMGPQDPGSGLECLPRMPRGRGGQGSTATNSSEHGRVVAQGICPQPLSTLRWPSEAEET